MFAFFISGLCLNCSLQQSRPVACRCQKSHCVCLASSSSPQLPLYIWQSFRKGLWEAVQRPEDVESLWQAAAEVSSSSGCIAAMLADEDTVSVMMNTDPLQVVSADRLMYNPYQSGSIRAKQLPDVAAPIKNLLLFAQLLAVLAAARDQPAVGPGLTQMNSFDLRARIQHQMEVLASLSNLQPLSSTVSAIKPLPGTQSEGIAGPQPVSPLPARCIVLLRSALLYLKLANLTQSVKADFLGHVDPEVPAAVRALWHSLQASSESLLAHHRDAEAQAAYDESDEEAQGTQRLCLLLIQHLVPMLQKCVKEPKLFEQGVACCHLLGSILTVSTSVRMQPAASELLRLGKSLKVCLLWCQCIATCHLGTDKALLDRVLQLSFWFTLSLLAVTSEGNIACSYAGAMPLLAAMLETNRALSKAVYPVLLHLLRETPAKSIRAEAESSFAQLNGARRLSHLLCPYFSPGDSACAKAGM